MKKISLLIALVFCCTITIAQPYFKKSYRRLSGYSHAFFGMCRADSVVYLNGQTIVFDSAISLYVNISMMNAVSIHTGDTLFCSFNEHLDTAMYSGNNSILRLNDSILVSSFQNFITGPGGIQFYNIRNHSNYIKKYWPIDTNSAYNFSCVSYNRVSRRIGLLFHQIKKAGYFPDSTIFYVLDSSGNVLHRTGSTIQNWVGSSIHFGHIPAFAYPARDGGFYVLTNGPPTEIIKTDNMGDSVWTAWLSYYGMPTLYDMAETPDGGFLICGRVDSIYPPLSSNPTYAGNKCSLTKFNANHQLDVTTKIGRWNAGAESQGAFSMLSLPDHDVVIIGSNDSTAFYAANSAFLTRRRQDGSGVWDRYYDLWQGVSLEVWALSLDTVPRLYGGGYLLSGHLTVGENTARGGDWGWLIRTDSFGCLVPGCQLTAVQAIAPGTASLRIYPNPATSYAVIQIAASAEIPQATLSLSDISGRILRSTLVSTSSSIQHILPVDDLPPGVYFITLSAPGSAPCTEKLVVGK